MAPSDSLDRSEEGNSESLSEAIGADLRYFVGVWLARAENPETGQAFTLTYTVAPALGGRWLSGEAEAPELGLEIHDLWGHDAGTGEIVRVVFQSNGNYGEVRSQGWEGDVLRLTGRVHTENGEVPVRETITRASASEFKAVWEALQDGTWTVYSIERVERESP